MKVSKGFTLIELLVVISIIALLMSIIVPALQKAKQKASSIWCLSNLRAVTTSVRVYSMSYDTYLPNSGRPWPHMGFLDVPELLLSGQYITGDSLHCPTDKRGEAPGIVSDWWRTNMGGPVNESDHLPNLSLPTENSKDVDYSYYWPAKMYYNANADYRKEFLLPTSWKLENIKHPSALIAFYHFWCPINPEDYDYLPHKRDGLHSGFMDGHAEFIPIKDIIPRDFNRDGKPDETQYTDPLKRDNMDWTTNGILGRDAGGGYN